MISFSCSCGKTYQLPDRHAGREVRCNQCHKALIVPKESQTEPVVPVDDQTEAAKTVKPTEPTGQPMPTATPEGEAGLVEPKKSHPVLPIAVVAIVALVLGVALGTVLSMGVFSTLSTAPELPATTEGFNTIADLKAAADDIHRVIDERLGPLQERLAFPASEVTEAVGQADDAKRTEEMAKIVEARQTDRQKAAVAEMQGRTVQFMTALADFYTDPESKSIPFDLFAGSVSTVLTAKDYRIGDAVPTRFAVKTLDGAPILLSLDADPVAAAKAEKGPNVLDVVADAVKDEKADTGVKHEKSFRIDSASREELRLIWPGTVPAGLSGAGLSGEGVKEFRFFLYIPIKPNAVFKPGKPEGMDKTLALSSIRLRLVADNGFIEYAPADNDKLVHLIERCRSDWLQVAIPMGGDENWKRSDFGLAGPLVIQRIELRAKPTGSGVTFWIDNLAVVE